MRVGVLWLLQVPFIVLNASEYWPLQTSYAETYPLNHKEGLVRIAAAACAVLAVKHDKENMVVVKATLTPTQASEFDKSRPSFADTMLGRKPASWKPWIVDIRGGNRLTLTLTCPIAYDITIPSDADIEIDVRQGPGIITYDRAPCVTLIQLESYWKRPLKKVLTRSS